MPVRILPKRSTVAGAVPVAGTGATQLALNEIAVNQTDRRIFVNASGVVTPIGPIVNVQTSNYILTTSDNNSIVTFNSATNVTVTVPVGLPVAYQCTIMQLGAGTATIAGATGMTRFSRVVGRTRTAGQYAVAGITLVTTASFILSGDTA